MKRNCIDILNDMDNIIDNPLSDSYDNIMMSKAKAMGEHLDVDNCSDYWNSMNGKQKISEMSTHHLACIPRHQIKNGVAKNKAECNNKIIAELEKRGCTINDNGFVTQN